MFSDPNSKSEKRESRTFWGTLCVIALDKLNKHLLSHSFTLFTYSPYRAKGQVKINHKMLTGYWKVKLYKINLHTNICGSSSQENIQTYVFTNSTNHLLIKFHILQYDKDYDVMVTLWFKWTFNLHFEMNRKC